MMLQLVGLSKQFKLDGVVSPALQGITLDILPGQLTALIGSNGSGKSTLLNIIGGSLQCDEGVVLIDGKDVTRLPDYKRSADIARIFQDPLMGSAPDLSLLENFRLAALRTVRKSLRTGNNAAFRQLVALKVSSLKMGLELRLDQTMGSFSGGQRQALTLCMATLDKASVLLLDEPTAALDPRSARFFLETAKSEIMLHGLCSLLVTHNLKDAITYSDRILILKEGRLVQDYNLQVIQGLSIGRLYDMME